MAVSLKHSFVSGKADGPDATLVQPSNWNAEHVLTQLTARLLGRTSAGVGPTEEITVGPGLTLGGGELAADFSGVQVADENLDALAALTFGANTGVRWTAVDAAETYDLSDFALTLLDDADAAAMRATLGTVDAAETLTNKKLGDGTSVTTAAVNWSGGVYLNPVNGLVQQVTLVGGVNSVTDQMADGESILLGINDGSGYTITWPSLTWVSNEGVAPALQTTVLTWIFFWKRGGALYGFASNGA